MRFSSREIRDLFFAGLLISVAFSIVFAGGFDGLLHGAIQLQSTLLVGLVIAFFTAGVGFLLHELMHKFVAQSYGLRAEFQAFYPMLGLALLFSLAGFIIAAPGAVFISGNFISRDKNGKISVAGPITNIVLAILFGIGLFLFDTSATIGLLFRLGFSINATLAAFNMIPVMPFDGAKVYAWNRMIYFVVLGIALALFFGSWFV